MLIRVAFLHISAYMQLWPYLQLDPLSCIHTHCNMQTHSPSDDRQWYALANTAYTFPKYIPCNLHYTYTTLIAAMLIYFCGIFPKSSMITVHYYQLITIII